MHIFNLSFSIEKLKKYNLIKRLTLENPFPAALASLGLKSQGGLGEFASFRRFQPDVITRQKPVYDEEGVIDFKTKTEPMLKKSSTRKLLIINHFTHASRCHRHALQMR